MIHIKRSKQNHTYISIDGETGLTIYPFLAQKLLQNEK